MKTFFRMLLCGASMILALSACQTPLSKTEYVRWVRDYDNEMHVQSVSNDFIFDLQYQPAEYVWLQRNPDHVIGNDYQKELNEISVIQHYTLTIKTSDNSDLLNFNTDDVQVRNARHYYLSYHFQDDITLHENGKVLKCELFHFERSTNGSCRFSLGFPGSKSDSEQATLQINSEMFDSLPIKIKIHKDKTPSLQL
jgi:hypothetical protein